MSTNIDHYALPVSNHKFDDQMQFLTWNTLPAVMSNEVRYQHVLPQRGIYSNLVEESRTDFFKAVRTQVDRRYSLSGIGSLMDTDTYSLRVRRATPQLKGTACGDSSTLCVQPKCWGFTEGVVENNNFMETWCWSLSMPCLLDWASSDGTFVDKMNAKFAMFHQQGPTSVESWVRTKLLRDAVKVVATNNHFTYSSSAFSTPCAIPFYIDEVDEQCLPCIEKIPGGIGGVNLKAFMKFVAHRFLQGNTFEANAEGVKCYGLKEDYHAAYEQTERVSNGSTDSALLRLIAEMKAGGGMGQGMMDKMYGKFHHDGLMPTFFLDEDNCVDLTPYEHEEEATIAGFVQSYNPAHGGNKIRGLLFVPPTYRYGLVTPPRQDWSSMTQLGAGVNFGQNTPGVFLLSSSMFTDRKATGTVYIGQKVNAKGEVYSNVSGLSKRGKTYQEAIRTHLRQTYTNASQCLQPKDGQLQKTGQPVTNSSFATGLALHSQIWMDTRIQGTARPILLLFRTDDPQAASAVVNCDAVDASVTRVPTGQVIGACPGGLPFSHIELDRPYAEMFPSLPVGARFVYRAGRDGDSYLVASTLIRDNLVSVKAILPDGSDDLNTCLPACEGSSNDDYGILGDLIQVTGATATKSKVFKYGFDEVSGCLQVETHLALAPSAAAAAVKITLADGTVVNAVTAAAGLGVFLELKAATGEPCDFAKLDCECLRDAVVEIV